MATGLAELVDTTAADTESFVHVSTPLGPSESIMFNRIFII